MSNNIIEGKLQIPKLRKGIIKRERLLAKVSDFRDKKVTYIVAPAGYGKTVFAKQVIDCMGLPFVWYQLDSFDNDPVQFFQYLTGGISRVIPDVQFNLPTANFGDIASDREYYYLMSAIIKKLENTTYQGLIIVFDDFHLISESVILKFMDYFLNYLPNTVHVIISCRYQPALELLRLKASELAIEINKKDLELNLSETAELLNIEKDIDPGENLINTVHGSMNGWALGTHLFRLALETSDSSTVEAAAFKAKSDMFRYISKELLTGLSADIQEFLLVTSVLENMTPEVCNYLLDSQDAAEKLKYIEGKNLFITVVGAEDNITYRYHNVFRELLLNLLSKRKSEVFDKAGEYYLQRGAFEWAVKYFSLAGDNVMLVRTIEQTGQQMLHQGRLKTVEDWLSILADKDQRQSPKLIMLKGELLSYSGRFAEAEEFIDKVFNLFKENDNKEEMVRAAIHKTRILRYRASFAESTEFINNFINDIGELPPGYALEIAVEKVYSQWLMGDILGALETAESALRSGYGKQNAEVAERLFRYMTVLYAIRGMYSAAKRLYKGILDSCGSDKGVLEQGSIPLYMAVVYREQGDLAKALDMLKESADKKQSMGFTEDLHLVYFNIAVTLLNYGDAKEVDYYCQLAEEAFIKTGGKLAFYEVMLKAFRSAFAAYFSGEASKEAEALMEQSIISLKDKSAYLLAYISPYFVIYYLKYKQYEKAEELLVQALTISEAVGIKFQISVLNGLKAIVLDAWGDNKGMYECVKRSLKLAADEHYERFFVIFPELLQCIRIAVVNGLEHEFIGKIVSRMDSRAFYLLLELLKHTDSEVRRRTVKLLKIGSQDELQKEISLFFFASDEAVRETGFALLEEIADEGAQVRTKLFVRCLGSFMVYLYSDWKNPVLWRTTKAKELFAYLLHWHGRPVLTERILADLWSDLNIEKARNLLHTNLTLVKSLLEQCGLKENLQKVQNGYLLNTSGISCDVWLPDGVCHPGLYLEDIYSDWSESERIRLILKEEEK